MKKPAAQHRQTTHAVARHAKPAAPAAAASSQTGGKGTATGKHHSVRAKHTARRARKWTPDEAVALCAVRAVATAAGIRLSDAELLAAYWSAAADGDAGLTIAEAMAVFGWPRLHLPVLGITSPVPHAVAAAPSGLWWTWGELRRPWATRIDEVWPSWR